MARAKAAAAPAPETTPTADLTTALVPLADLYIHPLNTRSDPPAADIEALADSIAAVGLLQNLAGFLDPTTSLDAGERIGIVAGGRRLRALALLASRDGRDPAETTVPVLLTSDQDTARLWASAENTARAALHPADEVRAYGRMATAGADPDRIAKAFAVTTRHVKQRLRLAQLPDAALQALRAGEISLDQAAALTAARDEEAALAELKLAREGSSWQISADAIRNRLTQSDVSAKDRRVKYIGLDAYRAVGGRVQEDLFTDATRLLDGDIVADLFGTKLTETARIEQQALGWKWVEVSLEPWPDHNATTRMQRIQRVPVDLPEADLDELDELLRMGEVQELTEKELARVDDLQARAEGDFTDDDIATSGVWIYVNNQGELVQHGPFRRPEDDPARQTEDEDDGAVTVVKPESPTLSASLVEDLSRIRLAALQAAALQDPSLLWDLLAWSLSGTIAPYYTPLGVAVNRQPITPDKAEGFDLPAQLTEDEGKVADYKAQADAAAFHAFRNLPARDKGLVIDRAIARSISDGKAYLPALAALVQPEVRRIWTPTAGGYFSRLPVPVMDAIWRDLVPADLAPQGKWAGLKKAEKARELNDLFNSADYREALGLSRDMNHRIDSWLPPELQWPAVDAPAAQEAAE